MPICQCSDNYCPRRLERSSPRRSLPRLSDVADAPESTLREPGGEAKTPDGSPLVSPLSQTATALAPSSQANCVRPPAARASRWREQFTSGCGGQRGLMVLALLVGVGAGLGAVAFRYMILGFTYLFTGHATTARRATRQPVLPGWVSGSSCSRRWWRVCSTVHWSAASRRRPAGTACRR